MTISWDIGKRVRCDLVGYGATDLAGKRSTMRVFPAGNHKGEMATRDLRSLVVMGRHGTRVTLMSHAGPDWQQHPWRCIRVLRENAIAPEKSTGLLGIRIPDIDRLDPVKARRTRQDRQESYPYAEALGEGEGWTYGRFGPRPLKGRVVRIRVDRDGDPAHPLSEGEALARAILEEARGLPPESADPLVEAAVRALRAADPVRGEAQAGALRSWWASGQTRANS